MNKFFKVLLFCILVSDVAISAPFAKWTKEELILENGFGEKGDQTAW